MAKLTPWQEEMKRLKELLMTAIESTSDWRSGKAVEYPDDAKRNLNSSRELGKLRAHVSELPLDHPLFVAMVKASRSDLFMITREENQAISRYGFGDGSEDPEAFIDQLTGLYAEAGKEAI